MDPGLSVDVNLGLLLLRLLLAALLFGHSTQKLLGWFSGAGPSGTAVPFEKWGFVPGKRHVLLAGTLELTGAILVAAGLLTPVACAIVLGTMAVAATALWPNGFWAQFGGCEVPFVYGALAAILGFSGPGSWSVDAALGLTGLSGPGWGLAVLAVGLLATVVPLRARSRVLRARSEHEVTS